MEKLICYGAQAKLCTNRLFTIVSNYSPLISFLSDKMESFYILNIFLPQSILNLIYEINGST